jgi:polynucleotide 5'-kinase involved in rRNA processing
MTPPPPSRVATGQVRSRHRIPVICVVTLTECRQARPGPDWTDRRHDLVAALDHAAEKKMTIISAPAGSGKTSLLRAWAGRLGQGRPIAFMSVRPGQHDPHRTRQSPESGDGRSPSQR